MIVPADALSPYVPRLVRRQVGLRLGPTVAFADSLPGAAMFVDISGSSALAERLAVRGSTGTEELSALFNAYFGRLIELIAAHGGDVMQFAGDGLLALWTAEGTDLELGVLSHRAARCGRAIQAALHDYPVADGIRLSSRVGVGCGQVTIVHVGGVEGRWEYVVDGPPILQVARAQAEAQPGEVVLSSEAWASVGAGEGYTLPTGDVCLESLDPPAAESLSPPASADDDDALRGYVSAAVLDRTLAGQRQWLAELRRVSVLFIHLPDVDFARLDGAQRVIAAVQTTIGRYEGTIVRVAVDDKGPTVLAAFGVPPLSHQDDTARAVKTAMAVQTALGEIGARCGVGLTTGRAFCGTIGNAHRCEYTIIGDVVHLAARLMQGSEGGISCDAATRQAAQAQIVFQPLAAIRVKGRAEPVTAYRPHGVSSPAGRSSVPLVGRAAERRLFAERLADVRAGRDVGVVVVEGEAGIGKSRLVEELLEQAREGAPLTVLLGGGDAIESSHPYHAWSRVFGAVFGIGSMAAEAGTAGDAEARRAHVIAQLAQLSTASEREQAGPSPLQLAPLLNLVLPLELPENDVTASMDSEARADNTRDLLVRVLQRAARAAPLLVILEDAHWLDSASWALARLVRQRVRPALLVVSTRPLGDALPLELRQFIHASDTHKVTLEALAPDEAVALVCQRLGVRSLSEPAAAFIRTRGAGNPFFSEELAYALRDAGLLVVADGECHVPPGAGDLTQLDFPDTVQGVVTSRIDRLTPSQQLTLKVASIVGRVFKVRTLRDVHPMGGDPAQLLDDLDTLRRLDITPLQSPEPEPTYLFRHIITQEVASNLMLFAQRRQLHRAVAAWYEREHVSDRSPVYGLLAHHWRSGVGDPRAEPEITAKAIEYLDKAGEQAAHSYANPEAIRFFTDALELHAAQAPTAGERRPQTDAQRRCARWEQQLGEAHFRLGNAASAREHLHRCVALLGHPVAGSPRTLPLRLVGAVVRQVAHRLSPRRFVGVASSDARPLLAEASHAHGLLALVSFIAQQQLPSVHAWVQALNLSEAGGPSPELAYNYAGVGVLIGLAGQQRLAARYLERGMTMAQQLNDRWSLARVWYSKGWNRIGEADWPNAALAFREALTLYEGLGDRRWCDTAHLTLANVDLMQGHFADSLRQYRAALAAARTRGDVQSQAWAAIGAATADLRLGDLDAVSDGLRAMRSALGDGFEPLADPAAEICAHGVEALAYAWRGERGLAVAVAERAAAIISQSPLLAYYVIPGYSTIAEVSLELWETSSDATDRERLARVANRARVALRKAARVYQLAQPHVWLWQGLCDWLLARRPAKAHKAWRKSLAAAQRLDMAYEEGVAHYHIGRHLAARDPARREHLQRAGEIFGALNAVRDRARVETALTAEPPNPRY